MTTNKLIFLVSFALLLVLTTLVFSGVRAEQMPNNQIRANQSNKTFGHLRLNPKFLGYGLLGTKDSFKASCEKQAGKGAWTEDEVVGHRAVCLYKRQIIEEKTKELIAPDFADFTFMDNGENSGGIATASFVWEFKTWARREDITNHFIVKLQDKDKQFPLGTWLSKVNTLTYRLIKTPLYVRLLTGDLAEPNKTVHYYLGVVFVRGSPN